jgi:tetratricopeptide (TPR) repeat protein
LIRQGNYAEATRVLQSVISKDPHYAMAYARLAEAWYDLDFQGSAQQELLIALPGRSRLTSLDRTYLDAIHATVTGDPSSALEDYKRILNDLPSSDRSSGYVDLGMAYERAGNIAHALASYAQAAARDSNNPAAYMHTGILQSRLHHTKEGDRAFARAQSIFENEVDSFGRAGNPEGLAELDFERGYAANDRGDSKDAEPLLERSRDEALKIPSIQLEIRALSQLSSVESILYHDSQAVEDAERAIQLARDNQLGSWAAAGLVRLANAQRVQGHLKEAEQPLQEAIQILHQNPQPRVEALANSTLASLMSQEHLPDKVAEPAQLALDYYKKNGFSEGATGAGLLLVRAERDKGQYKQALEDGSALLALAAQSGLPAFRTQAEETVGTVYLAREQYPEALAHFQNAEHLANSDRLRSYQAFDCGRAFWMLGRYAESEAKLKQASAEPALLSSVGESRVESLLSQQKYGPAQALAQQVIARNPDMVADRKQNLEQDEVVAEAHLGLKKQALAGLSAYVAPDPTNTSPADVAQAKLTVAEIYLSMGMNQQAHVAAQSALDYFATAGSLDSELRSACLAAAASKAMKDNANFNLYSKKVVDILGGIRQTWGPESFQQYISRPDMHALTVRAAK